MLSEKVIIVTGAGRGLGEATALTLGEHGARVVVNDLGADLDGEGQSSQPAEETLDRINAGGGTGMTHFGDVSDLDYTERLIEDTVAEYGCVDGIVNFAGILRDSMSFEMTSDEWDAVIDVHLRGHFALFRNAARHWRARAKASDGLDAQRSFLSVSSRAALGNVGQLNYSAAKAGVLGLTRTGAQELGRYNVRVNALMPTGYTRMFDILPEERRPFDKDEKPPAMVAPMVVYLMSDAAEGISGRTLRAAGETIGVLSEPYFERLAFRDGGWDAESIAERFEEITDDVDLNNSGGAL